MAFGVGVRAYDPSAPFGRQGQAQPIFKPKKTTSGGSSRPAPATVSKPAAPIAPAASVPGPTTTAVPMPPAPDTGDATPSMQALRGPTGGGGEAFGPGAAVQLRRGIGYRTPPSLAALLSGLRY